MTRAEALMNSSAKANDAENKHADVEDEIVEEAKESICSALEGKETEF